MTSAPQSALLYSNSGADVLLVWTGSSSGSVVLGPGKVASFAGLIGTWTVYIQGPRDFVGVGLVGCAGGAGGGSNGWGGGPGLGNSTPITLNFRTGRTYTLKIGAGGAGHVGSGPTAAYGAPGGETSLYDNAAGAFIFQFAGGGPGGGGGPGPTYQNGGHGYVTTGGAGAGGGGGGEGDSGGGNFDPEAWADGGDGGNGGGLVNGGLHGHHARPGAAGGSTALANGGDPGFQSGGGGAGCGANGTAYGGGGGGVGLGSTAVVSGGKGAYGYFVLTRKSDGGSY